jgi:hypothetical protein
MACLTVLYRNSSGETEDRHEKCYSQYPAQDSNHVSPEYRYSALSVRQPDRCLRSSHPDLMDSGPSEEYIRLV